MDPLPAYLQSPPSHLSERAREFFLHVVRNGTEYDAPARALLIRFCEVGDELALCRQELAGTGFTFVDKHKQPRIHPLRKHELALTNEFGKLFRLLGWDQAPSDDAQFPLFPR